MFCLCSPSSVDKYKSKLFSISPCLHSQKMIRKHQNNSIQLVQPFSTTEQHDTCSWPHIHTPNIRQHGKTCLTSCNSEHWMEDKAYIRHTAISTIHKTRTNSQNILQNPSSRTCTLNLPGSNPGRDTN
jgi:hypothetical protein